ncbi:MAG: cell cycle transcriptional regulator TrcR [Holosporales bacterium]
MTAPLMPKATALWLVENTTLTFEQIAEFTQLHALEIQAIADGEIGSNLSPFDPILNEQLTSEEIKRCEADPKARLQLLISEKVLAKKRGGGKYTPVSKRPDRPDAIAWILKFHPHMSDGQICKLLGTTRPTIEAVRSKTHWNAVNIKPRNPVGMGLCTEAELQQAIEAHESGD